jgi:hypothetical protein
MLESLSEPVSEPEACKPAFPQETPEIPEKSPEKEIKPRKSGKSDPEKDVVSLPEPGAEAGPEKETKGKIPEKKVGGKAEELSEEKTGKVSDTTGKTAKKGQKKGKGKPAAPKQYNLGDYL